MTTPVHLTIPRRRWTYAVADALKSVLAAHPGTVPVRVRLTDDTSRPDVYEVDPRLYVTPSDALLAELAELLGPQAAGGTCIAAVVLGANRVNR